MAASFVKTQHIILKSMNFTAYKLYISKPEIKKKQAKNAVIMQKFVTNEL